MSRPRRQQTWVYIDEELGHVPALYTPPPRQRRRHSRDHVRAQRQRAVARAERIVASWDWGDDRNKHALGRQPVNAQDPDTQYQGCVRVLTADRTPRGWGHAYSRRWRKAETLADRRLNAADAVDAEEATLLSMAARLHAATVKPAPRRNPE